MTAGDLDRIEMELNLAVPRPYREFMRSGRFGEGYGGTQDLTGMAGEVIEMTKNLRAKGFFDAKWPEHFLAIGDDGAGDYYFTDVQKDRPAVFFADHELTTNKGRLVISEREQYQTFSEFWEFMQQIYAATDEAIKREAEQRQKRRWWEFWIHRNCVIFLG